MTLFSVVEDDDAEDDDEAEVSGRNNELLPVAVSYVVRFIIIYIVCSWLPCCELFEVIEPIYHFP